MSQTEPPKTESPETESPDANVVDLAEDSATDRVVAHLAATVRHVRALAVLHLRRLQGHGLAPTSGLVHPSTGLSPKQVESRLARAAGKLSPRGDDREAMRALEKAAAERAAIEEEDPQSLPLLWLHHRFGLSELEHLLLVMCLACEFDPDVGHIYACMQNHGDRECATLALLAELAGLSERLRERASDPQSSERPNEHMGEPHAALALRSMIEPDAPLMRFGLIRIGDGAETICMPNRPLWAAPRIVRFVMGDRNLSPQLAGMAALHRPRSLPPLSPPNVDEPNRALFDGLMNLLAQVREGKAPMPVPILRGPHGAGKRAWVGEIARQLGRDVLYVSLDECARMDGGAARGLSLAATESLLHGAVLALEGWSDFVYRHCDEGGATAGEAASARALRRAYRRANRVLDHFASRYPDVLALIVDADADAGEVALPSLERATLQIERAPAD